MEKETQYARIRKRLHITLSPESHEWVKNNPANASRLIDSLINGVRSGIEPDYVIFSSKQAETDGLGRIRTDDPRLVKAIS
jgi:hypothetical protein